MHNASIFSNLFSGVFNMIEDEDIKRVTKEKALSKFKEWLHKCPVDYVLTKDNEKGDIVVYTFYIEEKQK